MNKIQAAIAVIVLAAAAAVGVVTAGERFGGPPDIDAIRANNAGGADPSTGEELLALLARGREQVVHTRYSVRSQDGEIMAGTFNLELWRRPPRVRHDSFSQIDGRIAQTAAFRNTATGPVTSCTKLDNDPWTCKSVTPAAGEFDSLVETVRREVRGNRVVEFAPANAGRNARCFRIESSNSMEICVTGDGVPTLITSGDARLELLELNANVKDADLTPPAPTT